MVASDAVVVIGLSISKDLGNAAFLSLITPEVCLNFAWCKTKVKS